VAEGVYPDGLPHPPSSLRMRMLIELSIIAVLTALFLYVTETHKLRSTVLYVGMALIGFALIGFNARETRERIWGPPTSPEFDRVRRCAFNMSMLTIPPVIVSLILGLLGRYVWKVSWLTETTTPPMFSMNFWVTLGLYLPWALLQQTLFQFYLLGRLRALLPFASPIFLCVINGILYGLVHLPDLPVTIVTIIGGVLWSYSYHRDRYVLPIAISHAVLGSTFYYWVYGRDLLSEIIKIGL
jgi:membrane protease YdiL (CAAX protease family)